MKCNNVAFDWYFLMLQLISDVLFDPFADHEDQNEEQHLFLGFFFKNVELLCWLQQWL